MQRTLHDYHTQWKNTDFTDKSLTWKGSFLENGYCMQCRYCCGPQDSNEPFLMALLERQIGPDTAETFYMHDAQTAYLDGRGCKALGSCGCSIPREKRPVACGLFPLVVANGKLYLYKTCPAVLLAPLTLWLDMARQCANWLGSQSTEDVRRISLTLPQEVLAGKYMDMEISLF